MDRRTRFEHAEDKIARLAGQGLDMVAFWRACTPVLEDVIPHYLTPCCFTLDPVSLLITSHYQDGLPEFPAEWIAMEYDGGDLMSLAEVARSSRGLATLHETTGGDPSTTRRWQANMTYGGDQEMITALRTRGGEAWGAIGLYREPDRPLFDSAEQALMQRLSPVLATAVRRALLVGEAQDPDGPQAPGMLVLDGDWRPETWSPGVDQWLQELGGGSADKAAVPPAIIAVAARAARSANDIDPPEVAVSRVLSGSGQWLVLHGVPLTFGSAQRVAVIIEPAHPARLVGLLMSAYGLTEREQEVTRLVLQGEPSAQIAQRLTISVHTVQEHLKNIFAKTGVRSRRDLVGLIFFTHYEPRVRDNEHRAATGRPLRGGPVE